MKVRVCLRVRVSIRVGGEGRVMVKGKRTRLVNG